MKHLLTVLILLGLLYPAADISCQLSLKMLKPKNMEKDLKVVLETLEAHPDPYTKISKSKFDQVVDSVRSNITKPMDEIDFYKNMSSIIALLDDGHTQVYFPRKWLMDRYKEHGVFPYKVYLTDDNHLHVVESYDGRTEIPLGAEILAIGNLSIDDLIAAVDPYLSYETIPFRNNLISEGFDKMLYLVFKQADELPITFKIIEEEEIIIETIDYDSYKDQYKERRDHREKKIKRNEPYDYKIIKEGIAKIDIFSFAVEDLKAYYFFLNKTFQDIKRNDIHSLIIDVRGNYGGLAKISGDLLHYIHNGYFKTMAKSSTKISYPYRRYFTDRYPQLRTANLSHITVPHTINIREVIKGTIGDYIDEDQKYNEPPVRKDYEFTGDCYMLTDRKSYSASAATAAAFQCYGMGYVIGEPTGGTKVFRASPMAKQLPKSDMIIVMSTTKFYCPCYDFDDDPVMPNVEVVPTMLDRVHKVDSQLNVALRLIRKVQAQRNTQELDKTTH